MLECDREAGDVADDGDGLVLVLVDDALERFCHAGDDVVSGLAVRDSLLQVELLNEPTYRLMRPDLETPQAEDIIDVLIKRLSS